MISVSDSLKEIIKNYPFLEEGLSKEIINYSAFARMIKPEIEKRLYKKVTEGSIVMALKRISKGMAKLSLKKTELKLTDITVRSNLTELTYLNSQTIPNNQKILFNQLAWKKETFCAVSQGVKETTFIVNDDVAPFINKTFVGEIRVSKINNLASLTIRLPNETVEIPGVYYRILKLLAWEKINVVEVISTYTELTIVLKSIDVERAFSSLKSFK